MQGSRGLATAKVVQQATEEPGLFVFGELLELPNVQEVGLWRCWPPAHCSGPDIPCPQLGSTAEGAKALALLQLFAYGAWPLYSGVRRPRPATPGHTPCAAGLSCLLWLQRLGRTTRPCQSASRAS